MKIKAMKLHGIPAMPLRLALSAVLSLSGAGLAAAQDGDSAGWQVEVTPYLWATRMKGDVEAGPLPRITVDMKFSDIFKTLDFGFMTAVEARKGRWGWLFDGMYMKVSDSATAYRSDIGLNAKANVQIEQTMLAGAIAYRVQEGTVPFDVVAGLRYNTIDVDADINGSLFGVAGSRRRTGDRDWIDPYVGARAMLPLGDRWTGVAYADVGGFGVGSDFTWQGSLGFDYAYSKTVTAKFGYRYMKVDYDDDGFIYDMRNDGLYGGVGIRF